MKPSENHEALAEMLVQTVNKAEHLREENAALKAENERLENQVLARDAELWGRTQEILSLKAELAEVKAENDRFAFRIEQQSRELAEAIKERNAFQDQCISRNIKETLTAPQPAAVPVGWKLVPVEPTQFMRDRGLKALYNGNGSVDKCYCAMISAAPEAPQAQDKDGERLDYLQDRGATVYIHLNGRTPLFEIGGMRSTLDADIRASIDQAMKESK